MYLQVTTRCNMTCEHCCYNCTRKGEDMSPGVFAQALDICHEYSSTPFMGGGEPTLHPDFDRMLLDCIVTAEQMGEGRKAGIITNGSIKQRAIKIAALAQGEVIWGSLSQDQYHDYDMVSDDVRAAFEGLGSSGGVHDTSSGGSREPLPHGRARAMFDMDGVENEDWEDWRGESECPCDEWIVKPNGDIYQCGCDDAPKIGDVWTGLEVAVRACHKSNEFTDECLENNCDELLYA